MPWILAATAIATAALTAPGPAEGAHVSVVVVSPAVAVERGARGAAGLLVPAAGTRVSRESALAALVRGRVQNSRLGEPAEGKARIALRRRPAAITFYVSLPPPGEHTNDRRYPIAVVGGGYGGLLESSSTRIPGLVSVADVAPSALALERGHDPVIESRPGRAAQAELARLDRRLDQAHDSRLGAVAVLVALMLLLSAAALLRASPFLGRAALLAAPAAIASALLESAVGLARPGLAVLVLALLTTLGSLGGARALDSRLRLGIGLAGFLAVFGVVLAVWPEVNALAIIGPHPDSGGRFYGVTNLVETLLLVPALVSGALLGVRWLLPIGALAVLVVGASRTGADGGGVLVLVAGFLVLGAGLLGARPSLRTAFMLGAATVSLGLVAVGLDAALGGSSHVVDALADGPAGLAEDFERRLRLSAAVAFDSALSVLTLLVSLTILALLWPLRPRSPVRTALLAAIAVSLLANDAPTKVAGYGVLAGLTLVAFEHTRRHA